MPHKRGRRRGPGAARLRHHSAASPARGGRPRYCRSRPARRSLHKMAARPGHGERRPGDKMAPGGQRGEGRAARGRGGERGQSPARSTAERPPPGVRSPSRRAVRALRVKPELPPRLPHAPPFSPPPLQKDAKMPGAARFHSASGATSASPPRRHRPRGPPTPQPASTDPFGVFFPSEREDFGARIALSTTPSTHARTPRWVVLCLILSPPPLFLLRRG